jgi:hypothetical protein
MFLQFITNSYFDIKLGERNFFPHLIELVLHETFPNELDQQILLMNLFTLPGSEHIDLRRSISIWGNKGIQQWREDLIKALHL